MKKASLLLLLLCVCVSLRAQTNHVYFDRLDIKKGLPESYIRAMADDSKGTVDTKEGEFSIFTIQLPIG